MFIAAHVYTAFWRKSRNPITMTPMGIGFYKPSVSRDVYSYAVDMATYGVRPHGSRPPIRFKQQAYASVRDDPVTTSSELRGDLLRGRIFIFTEASERFTDNLMGSKLTFVTQTDVASPDQLETRNISAPRLEINERVTGENHPRRIIPRHQIIARRLLYFKRRYPGIPLLISKRGVKSAFKLVPVSVCGYPYVGYRFGQYVGIYLALFFGWMPSAANWGVISTLAMQHVAAYRPAHPLRGGPEGFVAYQYVDDGAFIEPWVGLRPWISSTLWETAMSEGIGLGAFHARKREVEGCAVAKSVLRGIAVCAVNESFTLPPGKALRAQELIASPDFDPATTRIPLKKIQDLRGKLGHWSICNRALSAELRHIGLLLVAHDGIISPKGSPRELRKSLYRFLGCCRNDSRSLANR